MQNQIKKNKCVGLFIPVLVLTLVLLAACGEGSPTAPVGSGSSPAAVPTATPNQPATPTPVPAKTSAPPTQTARPTLPVTTKPATTVPATTVAGTKASLGAPFELRQIQPIVIESEGIRLEFGGVTDDSRCPTSGQVSCFWSGQVTALVKVTKDSQKDEISLSLPALSNQHSEIVVNGYNIKLTSVKPDRLLDAKLNPVAIQPSDYILTLVVTRKA